MSGDERLQTAFAAISEDLIEQYAPDQRRMAAFAAIRGVDDGGVRCGGSSEDSPYGRGAQQRNVDRRERRSASVSGGRDATPACTLYHIPFGEIGIVDCSDAELCELGVSASALKPATT